jgi:signal transduction histidine kinase
MTRRAPGWRARPRRTRSTSDDQSGYQLDRALSGDRFTDEAFSGEGGRTRAYFEVEHSPVRDDASRIIEASVFARDITERRAAEAEILRLNADLEQRVRERTAKLEAANAELETFNYSASHDLRAPLRAINGYASLLERHQGDLLDAESRRYLAQIEAASERMGILIEEMLDYSRLGRESMRAEPVPLEPLADKLRATFGARIAAAGGTLEVVEPLAVPRGDPVLLERILANLVQNALTFQRPDVAPEITISAARHGGSVTVSVADNGIGIPAQYRDRIFEVFTRLHGEEAYPGTGIGLSIVRKAARLMDSDVIVESTEGEGSTFSLELPAAAEAASGKRKGERP